MTTRSQKVQRAFDRPAVPQGRSPRVVGLDISTKTGFVMLRVHDDRPIAVVHETVKTEPGVDELQRADRIARRVATLLREEPPDFVVIENYGFSNKFTLATLVEIGTLVRHAVLLLRLPVAVLAPKALKEFVTGDGNADKKKMMATIADRWGFTTKDDNQADAFGLAAAGLASLGAINCNAKERAILGKLAFLPCIQNDTVS